MVGLLPTIQYKGEVLPDYKVSLPSHSTLVSCPDHTISYYTPVILQNIGITSSNQQLLLNALNIVFSFLVAFAGSFTVEKFGGRKLFLWGTFLTGLCYIPMNVITAQANGHVATGTGYVFIAFILLYGICFFFCWTPLQTLYPA